MIRKITAISIAAFVSIAFTAQAQAKHHHRHYSHRAPAHRTVDKLPAMAVGCLSDNNGRTICSGAVERISEARSEPMGRGTSSRIATYYEGRVVGGRPAGCPSAFCGCGTSLHVFGKIIPELNLAANWGRFAPANPAPGMVAYRSGHVFAIQSVNGDGTVVAYDPNSGGHLTRIHTVSLRGFHVVDPHSRRYASR